MNAKSIIELLKPVGRVIKNHRRGILTTVTIVAEVYAVYRAAKDGPKFKEILDTMPDDATMWDKVKALAPAAAPTVASMAISAGSAGLMYKDCSDTIRGLADAYTISQALRSEFEEHTEKIVGPEKTKEIRESIAEKRFSEVTTTGSSAGCGNNIIVTGHGNDLIYDDWSGRWFYSDINYVKKVVNDLNYQLVNDMYVSLNEYYIENDIPQIGGGAELGWSIDYGTIEIEIDSGLTEADKTFTVVKFVRGHEPTDRYIKRW